MDNEVPVAEIEFWVYCHDGVLSAQISVVPRRFMGTLIVPWSVDAMIQQPLQWDVRTDKMVSARLSEDMFQFIDVLNKAKEVTFRFGTGTDEFVISFLVEGLTDTAIQSDLERCS